jgi:hypothetical protein
MKHAVRAPLRALPYQPLVSPQPTADGIRR